MENVLNLFIQRTTRFFFWLVLIGIGTSLNLFAAVRYVPTTYPTISGAIAAATAGDTIRVYSNNLTPYVERVDVNKSVVLIGSWPDTATTIQAPTDFTTNSTYRYQTQATLFNTRAALVHIAPGTTVVIQGFIVDGTNPPASDVAFTGILVDSASATVKRNKVMGFLPSDTSGTPSTSLSGRGIEVLGGNTESLIDSNMLLTCQRYHILVSATDDKTIAPGISPKATVSHNTITGVGQSKLGQKGIWFNWGAYGKIIGNNVTNLDYTNPYIESDRGSGIVIKHGEYRTGGASRVLISGNTVTTNSFTNNKGIFTEGKGDTIADNIVTGFRFGIQLDDQDSAFVVRNTVTGGQIGVMVSTTTITPIAPYAVTIGGSPLNKNTITGQDTSSIGAAIALSFRDVAADGTFMSTIPVDARYNDFGVYAESAIHTRIWDRADTTAISGNLADTVLYYPFYTDKIRASVKVFLQGPYLTANDTMNNLLRTGGYLASHFTGALIPSRAVDSINIELRNGTTATGSTTRKYAPAWLLTDGTIRNFSDTTKSYVEFDTTLSGQYHVVVRHRNHLAIMDSLPQNQDGSTTPNVYDFSTSQSRAYGTSPMVLRGSYYALFSGDADGNLGVGASDIVIERASIGLLTYTNYDVDMNGGVGASDIVLTRGNIGQLSQVP